MKLLQTFLTLGAITAAASASCPTSPITRPTLDGSECDCGTQEIVPSRPDAVTPTAAPTVSPTAKPIVPMPTDDECGGCSPSETCVCETDSLVPTLTPTVRPTLAPITTVKPTIAPVTTGAPMPVTTVAPVPATTATPRPATTVPSAAGGEYDCALYQGFIPDVSFPPGRTVHWNDKLWISLGHTLFSTPDDTTHWSYVGECAEGTADPTATAYPTARPVTTTTAAPTLPSGTTHDCSSHESYSNTSTYPMGQMVHLNRRLYRARSVTTGEQPGLKWAWEDLGACKEGTVHEDKVNCAGVAPWTCDTAYDGGAKAFYDHSLWTARWWTTSEPSLSASDWEFSGLCA